MYEFRQRQQDLQTKMQEHSNADEKFNLTLVTVLELAKNAGRLFKSSSGRKYHFISSLFVAGTEHSKWH